MTLDRSDVSDASIVNMASDASLNANITVISNSEGSLDPYDDLDLTKHDDTRLSNLEDDGLDKVLLDLQNWGPF